MKDEREESVQGLPVSATLYDRRVVMAVTEARDRIIYNWSEWDAEAGFASQREQTDEAGDAVLSAYLEAVLYDLVNKLEEAR